MSDKVIRLGGGHAGSVASIQNLVWYSEKQNGKKFIVVSAVPEILCLVQSAVSEAFSADVTKVYDELAGIYLTLTGNNPSEAYGELATQLAGILKGIGLIGDYSAALKDQVLSFSEKLTAEIFQVQFEKCGIIAKILQPEQLGLEVTPDYGNATFVAVGKSLSDLEPGFYLVPGSFGITAEGKTARAGETAADYTAAFLTREFGIEKLELWGLNFDFHRADPAIVSEPPRIQRLTYSEASELAYFDHYSFHPRTVEPLEAEHIPIHVVNTSSKDGSVDTVINTETYVEPQIVKSVACTDDISLLRLNGPGVGLKPGILAKVTSRLNKEGINIKSVITSQISINLILERKSGARALECIRQLGFSAVQDITVIDDVSLVAVVGHGMQQSYGVSAKIFGAVAQHKINVVLSGSGASDLVSYLVVKSSDKEKSVREIYKAFF
ncbi:aspartate kinase [Mariniphaga anaerophila]|uniref:aspartate kinase n=1 Tax=Mariniphaga anaerophila TaxID=1484053 RepID=A0A1M5F744_9BACT|nr:aspartate kinase [Mariniphaga anaerophila]SHF87339.1 aspartate kinase [Mariniphaga anaerophila]